MARFVAGKVFHNLSRPSGYYRAGGPTFPWSDQLELALETAGALEGPVAAVASALAGLQSDLRWYRSPAGPFASVNFVRDHAHALLVGPGGIEERDDVQVGLTLMGPFTRFPDHRRPHPSAFLALSRAEVRAGDSGWATCSPGGIFVADEGCEIAMRCTRNPLLLLWCQRTRRR
ncbi:dimethylsulfonioproprionate lyase family protein [Sinorhizobium fredii]|uniref:dimethylsulfonioproprionate lyase family protein n=1 Tax=Rhizobium fredii TaxID=380 RepID=UPI0033986154